MSRRSGYFFLCFVRRYAISASFLSSSAIFRMCAVSRRYKQRQSAEHNQSTLGSEVRVTGHTMYGLRIYVLSVASVSKSPLRNVCLSNAIVCTIVYP